MMRNEARESIRVWPVGKMELSQPVCLEQAKGQRGLWEQRDYRKEMGRIGLAYGPREGLRGNRRQP